MRLWLCHIFLQQRGSPVQELKFMLEVVPCVPPQHPATEDGNPKAESITSLTSLRTDASLPATQHSRTPLSSEISTRISTTAQNQLSSKTQYQTRSTLTQSAICHPHSLKTLSTYPLNRAPKSLHFSRKLAIGLKKAGLKASVIW